jgi:hypothetical protein
VVATNVPEGKEEGHMDEDSLSEMLGTRSAIALIFGICVFAYIQRDIFFLFYYSYVHTRLGSFLPQQ